MENEFYQYNGQTYQYTNPEKPIKKKKASEHRIILLTVTVVILAVVCISANVIISSTAQNNNNIPNDYFVDSVNNDFMSQTAGDSQASTIPEDTYVPTVTRPPVLSLLTGSSKSLDETDSKYAILINRKTGEIIASKNANVRMFPASMTKIMSIIVAHEYMIDNDVDIMTTYATMTKEIADYTFAEGASNAGFSVGEEVRLYDVFYGATLPSGADAVLMLANFCYGDEDTFVDMMNAKAQELGLKETHFVTSTGLHHPDHYTTVAEMAIIIDYACKYDFLRALLTTTNYTYAQTNTSPQRKTSSTLYNWRNAYNTNPSKTLVEGTLEFGGKSGYTPEAKYCLATFLTTQSGESYIAVTGYASTRTATVKDYLFIYNTYANLK